MKVASRVIVPVDKARPKAIVSAGEIGYSGLNYWGGAIQEEFLKELKGTNKFKVYKEMMENDPIIGAVLFAISMLIRQAPWTVKTPDDTPGMKQKAEFLDQCREDMSMTWADVMSEILTMLPFGWAWLEIVYKKRNGYNANKPGESSRYSDGRIGWRKLPLRAQETLKSWQFDSTGGVIAMLQNPPRVNTGAAVTPRAIPIQKSLLFRTTSNKNNPEGKSILRNIYKPYIFKKRIEEIEGIGVERDLAGLPVLTAPEGVDLWNATDPQATLIRNAAETVVRGIRRDEMEGVLLPFGWVLELLSSAGKRQFDTTTVIGRYNNSMAMSVMADFIILGHNNRYGSKALAGNKTQVFQLAISGWLDVIKEVFNRYAVPRLFVINGETNLEDLPRLEPGDVEIPDLDALGQYILRLSQAGFQIFPNEPIEKQLLSTASLPTDGVELGREPEAPQPTVGGPNANRTGPTAAKNRLNPGRSRTGTPVKAELDRRGSKRKKRGGHRETQTGKRPASSGYRAN